MKRQPEEYFNIESKDVNEFIEQLITIKATEGGLSWEDISHLVNEKYGLYHKRHWYSSLAKTGKGVEDSDDKFKIKKLRVQLQDEKNQCNAYIRKIAREDWIKDAIQESIKSLASSKILKTPSIAKIDNNDRENILLISDWHYGVITDSSWNVYNTEICKQRVNKLLQDVIRTSELQGITKLYVLNLSDMIAGRIHMTIRLKSRIDVITQIMEVSEMLAEFLQELSKHFEIEYYSCSDNHSRLEPNKSDSIDTEALYRITDWYLKDRLKENENINFNDNKLGEDIITLKILGHNIAAVHGDKDSPKSVIAKLTQFTRTAYDMVCISHFHHFQANEDGETVLVGNGSLMGTDDYAKDLRLCSKPSQTLITVSKDNVCEFIHKIDLD